VGGIRFTAISIGEEKDAALLGPLVVDPAEKGKGFGRALVEEGLVRAKAEGFSLVLLVGDMPYYGRFGFSPVRPGQITLPGPVDPARLLAVELVPGALATASGQVKATSVSGLRGTKSCRAGRAGGQAPGSR
jgi:predicted N-acetyltransferase YhbS